jgi:hypothetical protein
MNYKKLIERQMVPEETLLQAEKLFKDVSKRYFELRIELENRSAWNILNEFLANGKMRRSPPDHIIGRLIENEETLLQALTLQTAAKAFLKTLPNEMEPLDELDKFVLKMNFCKGTLEFCMGGARRILVEME